MDMMNNPNRGEMQGMEGGKPAYLICIHSSADGQLSVGVEPEGAEGEGMEEMEHEYTPVGSIDEALDMAHEIFRAGGKMPEEPGMEDAKTAYAKKAGARPTMSAPGGMFGE